MVQLILSCKPANQGHSQDYIKGVLNLADLCSAQAQIHHLGKHLSTIDNARHPVCDDSHNYYKCKVIRFVCIVPY